MRNSPGLKAKWLNGRGYPSSGKWNPMRVNWGQGAWVEFLVWLAQKFVFWCQTGTGEKTQRMACTGASGCLPPSLSFYLRPSFPHCTCIHSSFPSCLLLSSLLSFFPLFLSSLMYSRGKGHEKWMVVNYFSDILYRT